MQKKSLVGNGTPCRYSDLIILAPPKMLSVEVKWLSSDRTLSATVKCLCGSPYPNGRVSHPSFRPLHSQQILRRHKVNQDFIPRESLSGTFPDTELLGTRTEFTCSITYCF
jgi:hypothetical protein